jgi:hypothetical protein
MINNQEEIINLEKEQIKLRRQSLKANGQSGDIGDMPYAGLALSGGGIRSATFCLGVLRGLASNGVLRRFDYLSTVSGGGYIGAALGRMYQRFESVTEVEKNIKDNQSEEIRWLRHNGRYLTPSGAKDWGILFSVYLRAWLAIQWEYFIFTIFCCSIMVLPHLLGMEFFHYLPTSEVQYSIEASIKSLWLALAVVIFSLGFPWFLMTYFQSSYIFKLKNSSAGTVNRLLKYIKIIYYILAASLLISLVTYFSLEGILKFYESIFESLSPFKIISSCMLTMVLISILFAYFWIRLYYYQNLKSTTTKEQPTQSEFRYKQTKGLRTVILTTSLLFLIGILDWLSWELWGMIRE